jgi:hypothetical protein
MAAPTYNHDLTDWIIDSDTTAWGELTNMADGALPDEADTESALQGTNTVSQATNISGAQLFSQCRILGTPVTLSSGQVFLVWHGHGVATALETYTNGGLRLAVAANSLANWKAWAVGGRDTAPFPYGKWVNNPIDPTLTAEYSNGTPPTGGTSIYGVGSGGRLTSAVAKGQPHVTDIIRYGRAEARIYNGELISAGDASDNPATFTGFAALNDAQTARWGLIQETTGGYLWKGLMTLGYSSVVKFQDSNKTILVQDTRKVSSGFNKIEVRQASSIINWTGISISCLSPSTTASKGAFEAIDNADINLNGCTFTDLDTFIFQSNSTIIDSTFRRCGQVTGGGASFNGCLFTSSTAAVSLVLTNLNQVTDCEFVSDGGNHAVNLGTISSTVSMNWNNYLTSYAVSDGSSGNEAILVNVAASQTLTINVGAGYSTPSVYNTGSGTVSVVSGQVTTSVTVQALSDGSDISGARVLAWASDASNKFYNASVTITGSGTTATVSHTGHGLATGDYVIISGVTNDDDYNGVHQITKINDNSYSFTADDTLTSPASGTIVAKWAILSGTTDVNGYIEDIRSFASPQPIQGWVRKTSGSPYYQQGVVAGTINTSSGFSVTVQLASDE